MSMLVVDAVSELCGRVIRVNHALPVRAGQNHPSKTPWEDAKEWYNTSLREEGISAEKEVQQSVDKSNEAFDSLQPAQKTS